MTDNATKTKAEAEKNTVQPSKDDYLLNCLQYIMAHYNRNVPAETLTASLALKDGKLTPSIFPKAAARAGLSAKNVDRKLKKLSPHVLPCILILNGGHPIVLKSINPDGSANVYDPGGKVKENTHPIAKIETVYTGSMLLMRPAGQQELQKEMATTAASWFWDTINQFRPLYRQVAIAAIFSNLLALASPLFVMNVYDRVVPNAAYSTLWVLAVGVALAFIFDFMLKILRDYFIDIAGRGADILLSGQLFQQVLNIRLGTRNSSTGAFANQLRDFESLREFFTSATIAAIVDIPFVLLFVLFIALIGGPIALVPLLSIPVAASIGLLMQMPLGPLMFQAAQDMDAKHGHLIETLNGLETIKATNAQNRMQARWEHLVGVMARLGMKTRALSSFSMNFTAFIQQMVTVIMVIWGAYRVGEGDMTVGALVACTILVGRTMGPVAQGMGLFLRFQQARQSLANLNQIMGSPVERQENATYLNISDLKGGITFKDVSFQYPGAELTSLKKVSFHIKPGERVALVGRTGSGKSTISKLLMGLYLPNEGSILYDDLEIRQLDPAQLRRQIGYVPQQVSLFRGSLTENVKMPKPEATDDEFRNACTMAGVTEFAQAHPHGFDLNVGEQGSNLSGGQRQQVTVARSLINNPKMMVLDEPTSEMDVRAEAMLIRHMLPWVQGKTMVLVTHRASILALVDRLIVMEKGEIIADGPKEKVIEALKDGKIRASI